ncbi:choice-of-anchor Q domain-containing protein, partial [Chloroflexota bacterium]
ECDAGDGDDIIHLPWGVYTLTSGVTGEDQAASGDLDILTNIYIFGSANGMYNTTILMQATDRVFHVLNGSKLHLEQLGVQGGDVNTGGGGGVFVENGSLELDYTVFKQNYATGIDAGDVGGALNIGLNSSLLADDCLFTDNGAHDGGAIYHNGTTSTINRCLFQDNSALWGGAIRNAGGTITVENSTFSQNEAASLGGAFSNDASAVLRFCTLVGNTAAFYAALHDTASGTYQIQASILADNNVPLSTSAEYRQCSDAGAYVSTSYNLLDDDSCDFGATGNLYNTDPRLLPLGDYGGVTWTHALRFDSPAIDSYIGAGCTPKDQRGENRPKDGDDDLIADCDRGAFETEAHYSANYLPLILR